MEICDNIRFVVLEENETFICWIKVISWVKIDLFTYILVLGCKRIRNNLAKLSICHLYLVV